MSAWGSIATTVLETNYSTPRRLRIHVLPERVLIADGIDTLLEHYLLVPEGIQSVDQLVLHRTDLFRDVFRPMASDCKSDLHEHLTRIGGVANASEAILYVDTVPEEGVAALQARVGNAWREFLPQNVDEIIRELGNRGIYRTHKLPETHTSDGFFDNQVMPATFMASKERLIRVVRLDDVVGINLPSRALTAIFPGEKEVGNRLVKYAPHFMLYNFDPSDPTPTGRVHSSCATGDINRAYSCDCGIQLKKAIKIMRDRDGGGFVVYHNAEGRGMFSLALKMSCYALSQENGLNTYEATLAAN